MQNQMTVDVMGHLRSISGQQSKIRGLRQKLQILREATAKQDTAVSHLLFVRRVPAVYRQCLAECMRRWESRASTTHGRVCLSCPAPPQLSAYPCHSSKAQRASSVRLLYKYVWIYANHHSYRALLGSTPHASVLTALRPSKLTLLTCMQGGFWRAVCRTGGSAGRAHG